MRCKNAYAIFFNIRTSMSLFISFLAFYDFTNSPVLKSRSLLILTDTREDARTLRD